MNFLSQSCDPSDVHPCNPDPHHRNLPPRDIISKFFFTICVFPQVFHQDTSLHEPFPTVITTILQHASPDHPSLQTLFRTLHISVPKKSETKS